MGTDDAWRRATRDLPRRVGTGKAVALSFYLHESALGLLPDDVLRAVRQAEALAQPARWNVAKIDLARPKVGFSYYPDFWTDDFPSLAESWSVDLATGRVTARQWKGGGDAWILHRKEMMMRPDDPRAQAPRQLTARLEQAGAFATDTSRIGKRSVWDARLREFKHNPPVEPSRAYSAATSLRQVPALHRALIRAGAMPRGSVNADVGGGRYDDATNFLAEHGVENLVYEPSRGPAWNRRILDRIGDGRADSATVANVLNVIPDATVRREVLALAANVARRGGDVWVSIYEGDGSGEGRETSKGWQENRRLRTYLGEVQSVFPGAVIERVDGVQVIHAAGAHELVAGRRLPARAQARKPNVGLGWGSEHAAVGNAPDDAVRFKLVLPAGLDGSLLRVMGEEGLRFDKPFGLLQLGDDELVDAVMQRAVDAYFGEPGVPWDEILFADGSAISDPGLTSVTVHKIAARPGGLFGEEFTPEVTVHWPPSARYFPAKDNGRARTQARRAVGSTRYSVWLGGHYASPLGKYLLASAKDAAASYLDRSTARQARIDREVWDASGTRRLRVDKGVAVVRRSDRDFERRLARYRRGDSAAEIAAMRGAMGPADFRPPR